MARLAWIQAVKEKATSKWTLGLVLRKQMIPLVSMENKPGRREASSLSIVLTVSGKSLVFSPGPGQKQSHIKVLEIDLGQD